MITEKIKICDIAARVCERRHDAHHAQTYRRQSTDEEASHAAARQTQCGNR